MSLFDGQTTRQKEAEICTRNLDMIQHFITESMRLWAELNTILANWTADNSVSAGDKDELTARIAAMRSHIETILIETQSPDSNS